MNPFDTAKAMGDLWGKGAQSFLDAQKAMFGAMTQAAPNLTQMHGAVPDLESFQAAQATFQQAWTTADAISKTFSRSLAGGGGDDKPDPMAAEVMAKIFDPRSWMSSTNEVDEALNRMAEGPRLSDLWNVERKFAALFAAWLTLRRRNLEHNTVMLDSWTKATGLFAKALNERAETGKPLESARAVMGLWVETANDVLLETQRSEAFLKSQREVLKASTDLRLVQQEIAEYYSQMFGYPTRAELDDVHRTVTELRRELRSLSRAKRTRPRRDVAPPEGAAS